MKRFSTLFILLAAMICLAGCRYKIVDTETGEGAGTTVAGAVISGAMIYEDAKDVVSNATESLDAMVIDTTNAIHFITVCNFLLLVCRIRCERKPFLYALIPKHNKTMPTIPVV